MAEQPPDPGGAPSGPAAELARLRQAIDELAATPATSDQEKQRLAGRLKVARLRHDALARSIAQRQRRTTAKEPSRPRAPVLTPDRPARVPPPPPDQPATDQPEPAQAQPAQPAPAQAQPAQAQPAQAQPAQPAPAQAHPARPTPQQPTREQPTVQPPPRQPSRPSPPRDQPPRDRRPRVQPLPPDLPPDPPGRGGGPPPSRVQVAPLPPETSSRFAQMIMLSLSVFLLGIAAVVFVGVIGDLEPWGQLLILLAIVAIALSAAPPVAHRGLTATAESITVVGLLLVGIAGYALWTTGAMAGLPATVYSGLVCAAVAAIGYGYHLVSRLDVPRWVAVIALQPVLPLLAYPIVTGPAGWALTFTLVAVLDIGVATTTGRRPLGYLAWALHGAAVAAAIAYAVAGLFLAGSTAATMPAALTLLLAAAAGVSGAIGIGRQPFPDLAAGLFTLAVIVSAGRVLALALPGQALLPVTLVAAAVAVGVRILPATYRKGPLWALIVAFSGLGVVVAALAVRAGATVVVWPPWPDQLGDHRQDLLAMASSTAGWQLAPTAAALTIGAAVAIPRVAKREATVAGVTFTALGAPVSLALPTTVAPWPLVLATAALAVTGLTAPTRRAALVHAAGASVTGLVAAGASLASPGLTAAVITVLTIATAAVALSGPRDPAARPVADWAAGAGTMLLPGAAATTALAAGAGTSGVLVAAFAAICGSLGYAAAVQLRDRVVPLPVQIGAALATVVVAGIALTVDGATLADRLVAGLLVVTAALVLAAPRIDASRRADRRLDGADLAAAALTAAVIATLARLAVLVLPINGADAGLATMAVLIFAVAVAVRSVPAHLRRGPVLGVAGIGAVLTAVAGVAAVVHGFGVLAAPGPVWDADLATWWPPTRTIADLTWAPPFALALLAVAAALVLPRAPRARLVDSAAYAKIHPAARPAPVADPPATAARVSAALAVLATISAPVALGMAWWTPAVLAVVVGCGYALSAAVPAPSGVWASAGRAATARATAGAVLIGYGVGASLARAWLTAAVLVVVVAVGVAVAALALRSAVRVVEHSPLVEAPPGGSRLGPAGRRLLRTGGCAVTGTLLALPLGLTAVAAQAGQPGELMVLAALAGCGLGLAGLALLSAPGVATAGSGRLPTADVVTVVGFERYLGYGTAGVAAGATAIALLSLPTSHPTEVYAAAAVLLAVLAELLREVRRPPGYRSLVRPPAGALVAAAVPAIIALVALAPALADALIEPYQALAAPWEGPPAALIDTGGVQPSSLVAALLLTIAAALAAVGFGDAVSQQAAPVIAPGLAVTLLIAPDALGLPWPAATAAALLVFTISVLGVALTPPPVVDPATRPLRVARAVVLGIGLAAGGAGLAGALADIQLTWATLAGAIAVGAGAALGGRSPSARLLGWLGAVVAAQLFALTTAFLFQATRPQTAIALLAVGAAALLGATRARRLRRPDAYRELQIVEWLGGYGSLIGALLLAIGSAADLAAVLIAGGAILGLAAIRPGRPHRWRRGMWWAAAIAEVAGWWIIMRLLDVGLLEAYTLPFALFALVIGILEARHRPELGSWATWGPGLIAALGPSLLVVVTTTTPEPARQVYVLVGGVAAIVLGSRLGHRAPLIIGTVVTAVAALHLLTLAGGWLVLVPLGLLLLFLGAGREKRARDLARLRGAYHRMR